MVFWASHQLALLDMATQSNSLAEVRRVVGRPPFLFEGQEVPSETVYMPLIACWPVFSMRQHCYYQTNRDRDVSDSEHSVTLRAEH